MVDLNNFESWAQGSRCYEQLIVVDDMNDSVSYDFRPSEAVNHLGLWMLITILHHARKPLYAMNNPRLWAQGFRFYELLMVMVDKKKFRSWAQGFKFYE